MNSDAKTIRKIDEKFYADRFLTRHIDQQSHLGIDKNQSNLENIGSTGEKLMFLTVLFSAFCLLAGPIVTNPSIEIIHQNHLETVSGRTSFLTDKLAPYAKTAEQINQEVQALAEKIKTLSPQDDERQILSLTEEMTQKMGKLLTMMPALNMALSIEEDFQQMDAILNQTDPLSPGQQQVIDRISSLCSSIEKSESVNSF